MTRKIRRVPSKLVLEMEHKNPGSTFLSYAKPARKRLHEIEDSKEFEAAFYGKHGMTPKDAKRR